MADQSPDPQDEPVLDDDVRRFEPVLRSERPARVALLDHDRAGGRALAEALREAGHEVALTQSLAASRKLLSRSDPDVIVLAPLSLSAGSVELELVEAAQSPTRAVPVLLWLDDLAQLEAVFQHHLPLCDFLQRPASAGECVRRVQLALRNVARLDALKRQTDELQNQVSIDFKTGLSSERHFRHVLAVEFKRARRHRTPLSLLYLDIDDFKSINDTADYAFGDEVLKTVAALLRTNLRETDFAARFGGDEFNALLPHTTPAEAVQTAMRIRSRIARTTVQSRRFSRSVTVSIGIDSFDGCIDLGPEDLRRRANVALQRSKRRGKNKVSLYSDDMEAADAAPEPAARRAEPSREDATGTG